MHKKFRSGKTKAIYAPITFAEQAITLIRMIDDMEDPVKAADALIQLLDAMNFQGKY